MEKRMDKWDLLQRFYGRIADDPCIDSKHIALYMALFNQWSSKGCTNPVIVFSSRIMPVAKISSAVTYFCKLRYLYEEGYIGYEASNDVRKGSKVFLG